MAAKNHVVVGIAGGSGSGKTTLSREVLRALGAENVTYVSHDFYYRDLGHMPLEQRAKVNFDHPDALETSLLVAHLNELKAGKSIEMPIYDFAEHTRTKESRRSLPQYSDDSICNVVLRRVESKGVIIVEGILIFCQEELRHLMDVKIFVDTEADIRFIRRMQRDVAERNRTAENVVEQYLRTVRPMHELFVVPSKKFCDVVILDGLNSVVLDMILAKLRPCIHSSVDAERACLGEQA